MILHANTAGIRPLATEGVGYVGTALRDPDRRRRQFRKVWSGIPQLTDIISALRYYNGAKTIQTTAPISHGSSGCALLDVYGRVLGIDLVLRRPTGSEPELRLLHFILCEATDRPQDRRICSLWIQIEEYGRKPVAVAGLLPDGLAPVLLDAASGLVYTQKPLTGLRGVWVCVENIGGDAKQDGLDPESDQSSRSS